MKKGKFENMSFIKWLQNNLVMILGLTSASFVLLYKTILINRTEIFPFAFEIGDLLYNLSFAILASAVFYFFVIYLKEKERKKKVLGVINMRFEQIAIMQFLIYNDILKVTNCKNPSNKFPKTIIEFKNVCSNLKLTEVPPPYFTGIDHIQFTDWYDYFEYHFVDIKYNIDVLYNYSSFLRADTLQLMHDTLYSIFHKAIRQYKIDKNNETFAIRFDNISHLLFDYLEGLSKFKQNSWI